MYTCVLRAAELPQELQSVFGLTDRPSAGVVELSVMLLVHCTLSVTEFGVGSVLQYVLLQTEREHRLAYSASHMVIICSHDNAQQTVLQGHCQPVSCLTASKDRSVLASADIGPDSLMVVWDVQTGNPIWSVSKPHPYGVQALQLTPDGHSLVAMSALKPGGTVQQIISIWDLSSPAQTPVFTTAIPAGEQKNCFCLSPDGSELITNGKAHICFWGLTSKSVGLVTSPTRAMEFKRAIGEFTMSSFLPDGQQAASGASSGEIILWTPMQLDANGKKYRKAAKILGIHSSPVYSLCAVDKYLVSGAADGYIRFFDCKLRLAAWFEDLEAGPIRSVSFSRVAPKQPQAKDILDTEYFTAPDFVVGSTTGNIVAVQSASFEDASQQPGHKLLVQGIVHNATSMVTHPTKPLFMVAGDKGVIQTWDLLTHKLLKTHQLPTPAAVTCMVFTHDGTILAVGSASGVVRLCRDGDLDLIADFRPVRQAITHMDFSSNGRQLAIGFEGGSVGLVASLPFKGGQSRWDVVGSIKPHPNCTALAGVAYGEAPSGVTKLFSLGKDGSVAEYDLQRLSPSRGLCLQSMHHICGPAALSAGATPTALAFAPPLPYFAHGSADTLLLVADDSHKFRVYNADSHTCVCTAVGPLHGGPVNSCRVFRSLSSDTFYIAYSTAEHVVGVVAWPLTGDPSKALGLVAHPGKVAGMNLTHDGCKLVTAGADDGSVMVWQMNSVALERSLGAEAPARTPLQVLVDIEGPDSTFHQDATDYFCYAQLASQGKKALEGNNSNLADGQVAVEHIMALCQALGFFPSDEEVSTMLEELAYQATSRGQKTPTHVDLQQFLALYLNYRPALQEPSDEVSQAFAALGADSATGKLGRDELMTALTTFGEPLTHEEMVSCMETLTGTQEVLDVLPTEVTASDFACGLLGFENALDTEPIQAGA